MCVRCRKQTWGADVKCGGVGEKAEAGRVGCRLGLGLCRGWEVVAVVECLTWLTF